ncbi:Peroxisome biogenesis protein 1 [Cocos nucifera]|uniref:Peroxisomal ATPase PEX1 n=1 Tax=Cocos nucifera TaxID=13894 RepID=A0A8K0IR68_COCNU|nr:Peroxisome biogenesis protein 1 [Cocos nucifera]
MELEVRVVGAIESCFVSLPLPFIHTLESTRGGFLPSFLALELRSRSGDHWNVAWSGSASMSSAIEVLAVIFVGIVYEGMKFPLWLHGRIVVDFLVVSTSPKKSVVQLVPGTEVAVAPKKRKKAIDANRDVQKQSSLKEQLMMKALLRVQAADKRHVHRFKFGDVELGVLLTSVVFIHPETASKFSFDNLQLITIFPRLPPNEIMQNGKDIIQRRGSNSSGTDRSNGILRPRVYVMKYCIGLKRDIGLMTLSPCRFKLVRKNKSNGNNGLENHEGYTHLSRKNVPSPTGLFLDGNMKDWSNHEDLLNSLSHETLVHGDDDGVSKYRMAVVKKFLIKSWLVGQLKAIASHTGNLDVTSVVLANETMLHFEVMDHKLRTKKRDGISEKENGMGEAGLELLYLLTITSEESLNRDLQNSYELVFDTKKNGNDLDDLELALGKLELGDPVSLDSVAESSFNRNFNLTLSSLSWMETAISDVIKRLFVLLSPSSSKLLSSFDLPLPGHVLIYGPSGSGKTTLMRAVAKHLEENEEVLAHIIFICCSKLAVEKSQTIRQAITGYISEALIHSPSVIIFDDLDSIVSFSSESEGSQLSNSTTALVKYLTDIMDEYVEKSQSSCGYGPIAFMASVQALGNLPLSLSSSGRFDFHVQLSAPAVSEREAMLKHEIQKRALQCSEDILAEVASKCDGYDAYDLEILVDRAVHVAVSRFLSSHVDQVHGKPILVKEDFAQAMHDFVPVAMRGLTKAASEGGRSGWEDVGGLTDIRNAIQEMVELPSKFPSIFARSPLRLRSNVLLYGPPGCGKTHIVGAAAAACSLRFISVKGPELLNKYIGASEQAVRDLFSKAAAAAPCLLFFDEFDSIAPKRGHDNTGVTDRVVNQLLTELDGVEALTGVFVFAATSRPDLLDAALLRPGRLDRLLFCDFPTWHERLDILSVLSKKEKIEHNPEIVELVTAIEIKLPLASNVNLETIASMTEGFSGADLQALLSDAQLVSVHELLDSGDGGKPGRMPVITDELLKSVASKARPSVSKAEKRRLYGIYSQFLESKKSVSAQVPLLISIYLTCLLK